MEDLISRKAAIDAIMDADVCVTWNGVISDDDAVDIAIKSTKGSVISSIVNMPSAQPETHDKRTETHACDLISRKSAIDAIKTWGLIDGLSEGQAIEILADEEKLPSAHPKIIRCRDCRHFEYDHPYIIQGVPVLGHEVCNAWGDGCKTDENGYCFLAERRTDEAR